MNVKPVVAGFVMAGLVSAGAITVLVVEQPAPVRQVQLVTPAAVESTATDTATVEPVVAPTTQAPAPVESTTAPAPVVAPKPEVVVPKVVAPPPTIVPAPAGMYQDGTPVKKDANGVVIPLPPVSIPGNGQQIDGHGVPIPTPTQ